MAIELKMPALSPTMEEGTLAKWLVKVGDSVNSGDLLAEIETDKATMEFEAVDEGVISQILVPEGSEGVKVGSVIALIGSDASDVASDATPVAPVAVASPPAPAPVASPAPAPAAVAAAPSGDRIKASPLAKRIAAARGVDLASLSGSGPNGRIVKADVEAAGSATAASAPVATAPVVVAAAPAAPATRCSTNRLNLRCSRANSWRATCTKPVCRPMFLR